MTVLAARVQVTDPETGRSVVFHKGAEPPARIVALLADRPVWADAEEAAKVAAEYEASVFEDESAEEPPRSGRGSGRDAWAAYAAKQGIEVEQEDSRDDIIARLTERLAE